ncbi:helix-turn-helix domain-containing protein [Rhodococcus opacus]|uniref:helix-turn-helix domain-containing protein n=1 Tax=Rhodococcus opacus TaxID=37919 RepID=UPI0016519CCC|nr:helix-turn-helix domain-containing protein [Rhodococcus opacus PD630]
MIRSRCWGIAEANAHTLNLHPNSLRGRLTRICELLGRDLSDAAARLDLFLALEGCALRPSTIADEVRAGRCCERDSAMHSGCRVRQ